MGLFKTLWGAPLPSYSSPYRDCTYDNSAIRWGSFPMEWGAAALHAHSMDPNVTLEGRGRAMAELDRRRERRSGW